MIGVSFERLVCFRQCSVFLRPMLSSAHDTLNLHKKIPPEFPGIDRLRLPLQRPDFGSWCYCFRKSEQIGKIDPKSIRELLNNFDGRISSSAFDVRKICSVEVCTMRQFFLCQLLFQAQLSDSKAEPHSNMFMTVTHQTTSSEKFEDCPQTIGDNSSDGEARFGCGVEIYKGIGMIPWGN